MLSDVKETHIKPGALELAMALNDVMGILKNPTQAYKELNDKYISLQKLIANHNVILTKNQDTLNAHKDSRVKQSLENETNQKMLDDKLKTISDLEKNISARETSVKVRETALNNRDRSLAEKDALLGTKEQKLNERDINIGNREKDLKIKTDDLDKQLGSIKETKENLRKVIG